MKKQLFPFASLLLLAAAFIVLAKSQGFTANAAKKPLAEQATIRRDTFGVPHILAETEAAGAFAMGYTQAEAHAVELAPGGTLVRIGFAGEAVKSAPIPETVSFRSEKLTLKGLLWKPEGKGPFPAVLYNHGSGRDYEKQFAALGPLFASRGYVFFAPYRRGHSLSADQGEYIVDLLDRIQKEKGLTDRGKLMVKLLETDHLNDQLAALSYLKTLSLVDRGRIAVAGNSFGGIQTVLMAERGAGVRAAVDFAGASLTWADTPAIRERMLMAVKNAKAPIYFIQAENDQNLSPSRELAAAMKQLGKPHKIKIFPPFGKTAEDGHSFGYFGGEIWAPEVFAFLGETMKVAPAKNNHQ